MLKSPQNNISKVTACPWKAFMKQSCDSADDYKRPVTANETISEKTILFYLFQFISYVYIVIINACAQVQSHKSHINTLSHRNPSCGFVKRGC